MSDWITDRRPINDDEEYVFNQFGDMVHYLDIKQGEPWMRIERPEPYVKPKRYVVQEYNGLEGVVYEVYSMSHKTFVAGAIKTREAAERIAAIYEEMKP